MSFFGSIRKLFIKAKYNFGNELLYDIHRY